MLLLNEKKLQSKSRNFVERKNVNFHFLALHNWRLELSLSWVKRRNYDEVKQLCFNYSLYEKLVGELRKKKIDKILIRVRVVKIEF